MQTDKSILCLTDTYAQIIDTILYISATQTLRISASIGGLNLGKKKTRLGQHDKNEL